MTELSDVLEAVRAGLAALIFEDPQRILGSEQEVRIALEQFSWVGTDYDLDIEAQELAAKLTIDGIMIVRAISKDKAERHFTLARHLWFWIITKGIQANAADLITGDETRLTSKVGKIAGLCCDALDLNYVSSVSSGAYGEGPRIRAMGFLILQAAETRFREERIVAEN